jgi:hypothetical protein
MSGMKRLGLIGTGFAVTALMAASGAVPAGASHPQSLCIDFGEDSSTHVINDGRTDELHVSRGTSDGDHPPDSECHIQEGGGGDAMEIDFEITGVADPDTDDSPETPDLTCTIESEASSCSVTPPSSSGGSQQIAAWVDMDSNNETVELDLAEAPDESGSPGDTPEPDNSDVVSWSWTQSPPGSGHRVPSTISIDYNDGRFFGKVKSPRPSCERRRKVSLRRFGSKKVRARDHSGPSGEWSIHFVPAVPGRFYAVARRKVFNDPDGDVLICIRTRSRRIRVR